MQWLALPPGLRDLHLWGPSSLRFLGKLTRLTSLHLSLESTVLPADITRLTALHTLCELLDASCAASFWVVCGTCTAAAHRLHQNFTGNQGSWAGPFQACPAWWGCLLHGSMLCCSGSRQPTTHCTLLGHAPAVALGAWLQR